MLQVLCASTSTPTPQALLLAYIHCGWMMTVLPFSSFNRGKTHDAFLQVEVSPMHHCLLLSTKFPPLKVSVFQLKSAFF